MRKHILVALASAVITGFCFQTAPAQLPGGLKIPKLSKPKSTPTPTETAQPDESRSAAQTQPSAPAASSPAAQTQPSVGQAGIAVLKQLVYGNPPQGFTPAP